MELKKLPVCPDCEEMGQNSPDLLSRREFFAATGVAVAATAAAIVASPPAYAEPRLAQAATAAAGSPESLVKTLFNSMTEEQKKLVCLPWDNGKRTMVNANWAIVDPTIGKTFKPEQQE